MRQQPNRIGTSLIAAVVAIGLGLQGGAAAYGQSADPASMPPDHATHKAHQSASPGTSKGGSAGTTPSVAAEIARLKEQVAQLQSALESQGGTSMRMAGKMPGKRMGRGGKSGMGMRGMMGMQGMQRGGTPGMSGMTGSAGGMMMDDMNMMGMGPMPPAAGMMMGSMDMMGMMGGPAAGNMKMTAALPGFPGASHIYHIGATGFFLDHPEHISLSLEQQQRLSSLRDQAVRAQTEAQRKIDTAEEELWQLTAADQPSLSKIESKIGEIEDLRADQRLDFIKEVGEAARVLTEPQRQALLGQISPAGTAQTGAGAQPGMGQGMEPMAPSAGMGDM